MYVYASCSVQFISSVIHKLSSSALGVTQHIPRPVMTLWNCWQFLAKEELWELHLATHSPSEVGMPWVCLREHFWGLHFSLWNLPSLFFASLKQVNHVLTVCAYNVYMRMCSQMHTQIYTLIIVDTCKRAHKHGNVLWVVTNNVWEMLFSCLVCQICCTTSLWYTYSGHKRCVGNVPWNSSQCMLINTIFC